MSVGLPARVLEALAVYRQYHPIRPDELPNDAGSLALQFTRLPKAAASELTRAFGEKPSISDFRVAFLALLAKQGDATLSEHAACEVERLAGRLHFAGATIRNHPSQLRVVERPNAAAIEVEAPGLPHGLRSADEVSDWLAANGFGRLRKRGSHQHWILPGGTAKVCVAEHKGDIPPGTLSNIRRQIDSAFEEAARKKAAGS